MAPRIFLAHAREDKSQIRKLYADLRTRGFDPWFDEEDLEPGQIWKVEIPTAIRQAGIFLACLSSQSVGKVGYVQSEFRLALSALAVRPSGTIFLIPVRLDECDVPNLQIPDLGMSLRDIQWVNLWQEGGFNQLVRVLEKALKKPETQRPPEPSVALPLGVAPDIAPDHNGSDDTDIERVLSQPINEPTPKYEHLAYSDREQRLIADQKASERPPEVPTAIPAAEIRAEDTHAGVVAPEAEQEQVAVAEPPKRKAGLARQALELLVAQLDEVVEGPQRQAQEPPEKSVPDQKASEIRSETRPIDAPAALGVVLGFEWVLLRRVKPRERPSGSQEAKREKGSFTWQIAPLIATVIAFAASISLWIVIENTDDNSIKKNTADGSKSESGLMTMVAGETFRDCDYCPSMVVVPAGSFKMGSPRSEKGREINEGPQHNVTIAKPFAVGQYEVTNDEWDHCVRAGDCPGSYKSQGWFWTIDRRPVFLP